MCYLFYSILSWLIGASQNSFTIKNRMLQYKILACGSSLKGGVLDLPEKLVKIILHSHQKVIVAFDLLVNYYSATDF
jgi:hypothetical protein